MSKASSLPQKKRRFEDAVRDKPMKPKKKIRKQKDYHSSSDGSEESEESEAGFAPIDLNDSDEGEQPSALEGLNGTPRRLKESDDSSPNSEQGSSDGENDGNYDSEDSADRRKRRVTSKRNDPEAFSKSMSKILSTKLSQSARKDPVLSRSRQAAEASSSLANERLEKKAKAKLRADKREEKDRGRVKDVLGLDSGKAGELAEEEKRLRKIAQRGVVKLFNAVRAAQVRGEQAAKEQQKKGTVGITSREEKVKEMSKQGFLDLITGSMKNKSAEAT